MPNTVHSTQSLRRPVLHRAHKEVTWTAAPARSSAYSCALPASSTHALGLKVSSAAARQRRRAARQPARNDVQQRDRRDSEQRRRQPQPGLAAAAVDPAAHQQKVNRLQVGFAVPPHPREVLPRQREPARRLRPRPATRLLLPRCDRRSQRRNRGEDRANRPVVVLQASRMRRLASGRVLATA